MAVDIVPELLRLLRERFGDGIADSKEVKRITERITNGTATLADVHDYSIATGESLSQALREILIPERLPDGRIYWNIADRTIRPLIEQEYSLVNETAEQIQTIVNESDGIRLEAVRAEFPQGRIHGFLDKLVTDEINQFRWLLEPVINISESFSDDYMMANADARYKAGLKVSIIRETESAGTRSSHGHKYFIPCDWCSRLAGEYAYPGVPPAVFQRHESCRCRVTYKNERQRQNVWSKEIWQTATPEQRLSQLRESNE